MATQASAQDLSALAHVFFCRPAEHVASINWWTVASRKIQPKDFY